MSRAGSPPQRDGGRVVVVGDLVTDVLVELARPPAPGTDTAARIRLTGGGQAANTAAWLAATGVPVTLVATVGDDPAGRERVAELVAAGVECAVRPVAGAATGTLVVLADRADRTMLTDRGAADRLRPADVAAAVAGEEGPAHLHLSGYALLSEGSRRAGRHALTAARARGWSSSVDAASAAPLRRAGAGAFLDWIAGVDLLLANTDEAAVLAAAASRSGGAAAPRAPADQARALTAYARVVVVKRGGAGAVWAGGGTLCEVPAVPGPVREPTGAGDAFAAGLLAAWLAGADPAPALRAGARLGARAVAGLGARPPVPD